MCMPDLSPRIFDYRGYVICMECEERISEEQLWQNAINMWIKAKGDNG